MRVYPELSVVASPAVWHGLFSLLVGLKSQLALRFGFFSKWESWVCVWKGTWRALARKRVCVFSLNSGF